MNLREEGEGEQVNRGFYSGLPYSYPLTNGVWEGTVCLFYLSISEVFNLAGSFLLEMCLLFLYFL